MNAGFLGQGLMMTFGGTLLFWSLPPLRKRGVFLALAVLHGLGAMLAVGGGNAAVILVGARTLSPLLGPRFSRTSMILGCVGLLSVVVHLVTKTARFVNGLGVSERIAVYTILAWQMLFAAKILAGGTGQQAGTALSVEN